MYLKNVLIKKNFFKLNIQHEDLLKNQLICNKCLVMYSDKKSIRKIKYYQKLRAFC